MACSYYKRHVCTVTVTQAVTVTVHVNKQGAELTVTGTRPKVIQRTRYQCLQMYLYWSIEVSHHAKVFNAARLSFCCRYMWIRLLPHPFQIIYCLRNDS